MYMLQDLALNITLQGTSSPVGLSAPELRVIGTKIEVKYGEKKEDE